MKLSTKISAAVAAVTLSGAGVGTAVALTSGSSTPTATQVIAPSAATDSTTTIPPDTTTAIAVTTTTAPPTTQAPAPTTTFEPTTITTLAQDSTNQGTAPPVPTTVPMPTPPPVTYTIAGSCHIDQESSTATCAVTVSASDGSTPTGEIVMGAQEAYTEAQLTNGSATISAGWDGKARYANLGYRGGPDRGADVQIPFT